MEILLTLPGHFAKHITRHPKDYHGFSAVYSDPPDRKLGSGGGTVNVVWQHLAEGKRIIVHSDGQSRRLPAYAAVGKAFIPFPVFRWSRGQRIDQTLFDLQRPLLEKILEAAPEGMNTLVASGDALVWAEGELPPIPSADVVCFGAWAQPETAAKHGVFVVSGSDPGELVEMLQKPSPETLQGVTGNHHFLLDTGIWLLSDSAIEYLFLQTGWENRKLNFRREHPEFFDLYSGLGIRLGSAKGNSTLLSTRVVPLADAAFYHFGSNHDLLASTRALHDRVSDQRGIWHKKIKPSPDIFVQNASTAVSFQTGNNAIWIENACIPATWTLHDHHILTGIPGNEWSLDIPAGLCLEMIPVRRSHWCIRPYGFHDRFSRSSQEPEGWFNRPAREWFQHRNFPFKTVRSLLKGDLYECPIFPVLEEKQISGEFMQWLLDPSGMDDDLQGDFRQLWLKAERLSASGIIDSTNHQRVSASREHNLRRSIAALSANRDNSIFYQLDLHHLASKYRSFGLPWPPSVSPERDTITRVHDLMFRSVLVGNQTSKKAKSFEDQAFAVLREGLLASLSPRRVDPVMNIQHDQIVWGRSPVRLDLAGGWTDTPPYCLIHGGKVVNMAVELNGQPPIQVFIRALKEPVIILRSVDLGVSEMITTYKDLSDAAIVGSAFSIPRAALMLAGFHPGFSARSFRSLRDQLKDFGGGLDISLMVAVPKGSGLGTSSILAATLLGTLSDICSHHWSRGIIAGRTLILEQILTTGGGWQDQYGGIFEGVKLVESLPGIIQNPTVGWTPDHLFTRPVFKDLILLYYTGITRVARQILAEIVKGMFLNSSRHLGILSEMKQHAGHTRDVILRQDWNGLAASIGRSWELNKRLDSGTNPAGVEAILGRIRDLTAGYKLLGAGGGGYLMIFAKEREAAMHIRRILETDPPNPGARFVDWELSGTGLEITKS